MFQPLLISNLIDHAERYHADTAIISKNTDGSITETNWAKVAANSKRFANVLKEDFRKVTAWRPSHGTIIVT